MLETVPSFSAFNTASSGCDDDDDEEKEEQVDRDRLVGESIERTVTIEDSIKEAVSAGNEDFSFSNNTMGLIEEGEEKEEEEEETFPSEEADGHISSRMYVPAGLGFDGGIIDEEEILLQSKGALSGTENGEVLLWKAKSAWELHHDQERALHYFERAVESSPKNSDVMAAYASFLWETEDREDEAAETENQIQAKLEKQVDQYVEAEPVSKEGKLDERSRFPTGLSVDMADLNEDDIGEGSNIEDYYKKMVEENLSDPSILAKYAKFLYESKGDLQGAEEYYSRACLTNPTDGVTLAACAKLVWQLYQDHDKASSYYERAVQASPEDSNILAAYASFLWDTEKDDLVDADCFQEPNHQNESISTRTA